MVAIFAMGVSLLCEKWLSASQAKANLHPLAFYTIEFTSPEHRMFSFISMNWKGEPLVSFETVVKMISATKTRQELRVKAVLDKSRYETGLKISREQMEALNIQPHRQNPEWNYSLLPRSSQSRNE
jgi:hypothetical protein